MKIQKVVKICSKTVTVGCTIQLGLELIFKILNQPVETT